MGCRKKRRKATCEGKEKKENRGESDATFCSVLPKKIKFVWLWLNCFAVIESSYILNQKS
jgi:hypothetical protein